MRKILGHTPPAWVPDGALFFITICTRPRGLNQLAHPQTAAAVLEAVEFRRARGDWFVPLVLLMPDHVHGLFAFAREAAMRKTVANFKEATAKRVGIRWQRDFFDHRLRGDEGFEEKAEYIRMNPVRAGLVATATDWVFRSEG